MWTSEKRPQYDRSKLRYPSDLTDEEWSLIGPLSISITPSGSDAGQGCAAGASAESVLNRTGKKFTQRLSSPGDAK